MIWNWFRLESEDRHSTFEGRKSFRGHLEVTIRLKDEWITMKVDKKHMPQLINWLCKSYKYKPEVRASGSRWFTNTSGVAQILPIRDPQKDPE